MDVVRDSEGSIPLGDPTITRGRPCYEDGEAILPADVDSIEAFAYQPGQPDPFWTETITIADVLSETATVSTDWTRDDIGWTFRDELLYGPSRSYYPPLGIVWIEYVLRFVSGATKTVVRETSYVPGRAVAGGHFAP